MPDEMLEPLRWVEQLGKHKKHQPLAAAASASLVHYVLSKPTALDGLPEPPIARAHAAGAEAAEVRAASATATDLDEAKAALLRTAEVAVLGFVAGSEEQEVSLRLENDRERRAAKALAAEGKAKLVGDVVRITVWRS